MGKPGTLLGVPVADALDSTFAAAIASAPMHRFTRLASTTAVAVFGACGVHVLTQGTTSTLASCSVPALQAKAPGGTTLTGAKVVEATTRLPKYCQVDGRVGDARQ